MAHGVLAVDNPLNGYVEGHSDSEDLGIFVLSPGAINSRNEPPTPDHIWLWREVSNSFIPEEEEFDTDTL